MTHRGTSGGGERQTAMRHRVVQGRVVEIGQHLMVSRMEANRHTSAAQRGNAGAVQHVGGWQVRGELAHAFPQLLASLTSQHEGLACSKRTLKQRHRLFRTMRQEKRFQLLEAVGPLAVSARPERKNVAGTPSSRRIGNACSE